MKDSKQYGIFEQVEFLNEGLFKDLNKSDIYMLTFQKYDNITHPSGCKSAKDIINILFSNYYDYENGKYIIDHIEEEIELYLYKITAKGIKHKIVNTKKGKVEYIDSNKPISQELLKKFSSLKDVASYANIPIQYIGPNKDAKVAVNLAKSLISKAKIKYTNIEALKSRIHGFTSIEEEIDEFQNGYSHVCFLSGIVVPDSVLFTDEGNYIIDAIDKLVKEINNCLIKKNIKDIKAESDWIKNNGVIYLKDRKGSVSLGMVQVG